MTYCVGMRLNKGLVFMSDTRTNAGVDDISQVRKMRSWHVPGERVITLMSAGNLATTQAVVSLLDERTKAPEERQPSILQAPSMFQVATIVGETLRQIVLRYGAEGPAAVFQISMCEFDCFAKKAPAVAHHRLLPRGCRRFRLTEGYRYRHAHPFRN